MDWNTYCNKMCLLCICNVCEKFLKFCILIFDYRSWLKKYDLQEKAPTHSHLVWLVGSLVFPGDTSKSWNKTHFWLFKQYEIGNVTSRYQIGLSYLQIEVNKYYILKQIFWIISFFKKTTFFQGFGRWRKLSFKIHFLW